MRRWTAIALLGLACVVGLVGCQGTGRLRETAQDGPDGDPDGNPDGAKAEEDDEGNRIPEDEPDPVEILPNLPSSEPRAQVRADTESRRYGADPRFAALAAAWPDHVRAAMRRLPVVTGLVFAAGPPPRVVLAPLNDERVPFEVRAEVHRGRRRASVFVNAERLLSGVAPVDQTLLAALGAAVLEDSRSLRGDLPSWVFSMAGMAASGDLEHRLMLRHRNWVLGDRNALNVDPHDDDAAEGTALGAFLLLAERGKPTDVRRLLQAVAGGDEPSALLARIVGERADRWGDAARVALAAHIRDREDAPWLLLQTAETALEESGRAGLLAALPPRLPSEIGDEVRVLRARAALDVGDGAAARSELQALSGEAYRVLRDPAAAVVLRVEAEIAKGGDASQARELARQHELDFPKHPAGERLRRLASERGMQEDPQAWMRAMGRRIAEEGTGNLDLAQLGRYGRALLLDHRAGAAQQFLLGLGARGTALELHPLAEAVADAQEDPTIAARARASDRIGIWLPSRTAENELDVVQGGVASALVLSEMLISTPDAPADQRAQLVDLLARCAGEARVLRAMDGVWRLDNRSLLHDLAVISRSVSLDVLEVAIFDSTLPALAGRPAQDLWDAVAFGLTRAWLKESPAFLERIRDPVFDVRRRALEALARDTTVRVPPALIGHLLTDRSPVLRSMAVELAGRGGFRALAEKGLEDQHPSVRRSAATALAQSAGANAVGPLLRLLREDPRVEVRAAAAFALLDVASDNTMVVAALLATQRDEDPRLREPLEREISTLSPVVLGPALVAAIRKEMGRRPMSRAALFHWMAIFQRASGIDPEFHPASTRTEVQAMVGRIRAWSQRAAGR